MRKSLLHTKKSLVNEEVPVFDPCPVCGEELYYRADLTNRVALVDEDNDGEFIGWVCPFCISKFDNKDNIVILLGDKIQGKS